MVDSILSYNAFGFIPIIPAGVHIAIETRKIAARDLDPEPMSGSKVVTGGHRLKFDIVNLARFHPDERFVVAVAVAHTLDGFVEVPCLSVFIDVDQLDRKVGVFCVR